MRLVMVVQCHGGSMKLRPAWLAILTGLGLLASSAGLAATQAPASQKKEQTGKKQAAPGASLSGCIDQQEGHYVLVDDRNLSPVADLEADGFETEGFAKHMGHKVTVRGISNSGSTRPVFKVRSIETISETCAPTPQSDKKQQ
jgi:hypothetical protein